MAELINADSPDHNMIIKFIRENSSWLECEMLVKNRCLLEENFCQIWEESCVPGDKDLNDKLMKVKKLAILMRMLWDDVKWIDEKIFETLGEEDLPNYHILTENLRAEFEEAFKILLSWNFIIRDNYYIMEDFLEETKEKEAKRIEELDRQINELLKEKIKILEKSPLSIMGESSIRTKNAKIRSLRKESKKKNTEEIKLRKFFVLRKKKRLKKYMM